MPLLNIAAKCGEIMFLGDVNFRFSSPRIINFRLQNVAIIKQPHSPFMENFSMGAKVWSHVGINAQSW